MMSNPVTQKQTANPRTSGAASSSSPRMAIQAARGAKSNETPNQTCASAVKRFVKEYAQRKSSTGTDSMSGQALGGSVSRNSAVDAINPIAHRSVKSHTAA